MEPSSALPSVYVLDASVAVTGAFVAARNMARVLKDRARVVLVLPESSVISYAECADFWRVEHVPHAMLSKQPAALLAYIPNLLFASLHVRRLMRKDGASNLILNDFYAMHGVLLRLMGYRGRIITLVRCVPRQFVGGLAPLMLWLQQRSAHRIVAVSHYIRGLLPSRVAAIVLYDFYKQNAHTTKDQQPEKRFLFIGNYIPGKGQDMALEAFALAAKEDPEISLCFCGGDMGLAKNRAYREALQQRAIALGIEARVQFREFVADTSELLASSYAALNFSASESFSMTVLEASGAGLPVIATQSGGPQEIIVESKTGYLIPVGDVLAATQAIRKLAADPALAHAMGQAGAAHVAATFTRDAFAQSLRELLAIY